MKDRMFSSLNLLLDNVEGINLLLEYLFEFSGRLHSAGDFESILKILNKELRKIYIQQKIEIILWQNRQRIVRFEFEADGNKINSTEDIINQNTLYKYILENQQTILTNNYLTFCENINVNSANLPARSWLGIPMIVRKKALGALVIWNDHPKHYLRLQDKQFLSSIADIVSIALENIYLHDYLSEENGSLKLFEPMFYVKPNASSSDDIIAQLMDTVSKQPNIVYTGLFLKKEKQEGWKLFGENSATSISAREIELLENLPQISRDIFAKADPVVWRRNSSLDYLGKLLDKSFTDPSIYSALLFPFNINQTAAGIWILAFGKDLKNEKDGVHAYSFISRIIVQLLEKKALQDEKIKYSEQSRHLEKTKFKDELASGAVHHLKNIFSIIYGNAELLKKKLEGSPSARELELLLKAAQDGANSIQRLHPGPTQNESLLKRETLTINEIIREVVEIVRPKYKHKARTKGIEYELQLSLGNIHQVMGDSTSIREMLLNLINNAIDAMPRGGTLSIQTSQKDDKVLIFISDTGVGIPNNLQNKIFESFYSTKGEKGNGLGLSIAERIIKEHGGTIQVDSILNKGSIFMIELPSITKNQPSIRYSNKQPIDWDYKILLVDDEGLVRETLAEMLRTKGCDVMMASNATEALLKFQKFQFDVIFTDLNMPGTSGIELARKLKKINPTIPIFIITGWNYLEKNEINGAVDGIIGKPFNVDRIMNEIRQALTNQSK